jgi:phage shock protein A
MFGWFKRLAGIFGSKAEAVLDKIEDPKAALNQVIKDMAADIHATKVHLGQAQIECKRSRIEEARFVRESENYRIAAEGAMDDGDESRARHMLRRAFDAERTAENFKNAADRLDIEVDRLRESVTLKERKFQEAKSAKHALLAQKTATASLAQMSNSAVSHRDASNAFAEFDRINEKIMDESIEAQVSLAVSTEYYGGGDVLMIESNVDRELDMLKRKLKKDTPKLTAADEEQRTSKN